MVKSGPSGRDRIGVVLPARETFALRKSGAIALCIRDFANYSRFRDEIAILGAAECEYPDVRYVRLTDWRRWWRRPRTAYALGVIRAAREGRYDVIEVQNRPYMIARLRKELPRARIALHLHNDPLTMDGSRSLAERRRLLRETDAVYCVSRFIRAQFLQGIDDPEGKAMVVYNGVAANPPTGAKTKIVAFAGRVIAIKGVVELVRAFAEAAPDMADWRLVIAGDDPGGLLAAPDIAGIASALGPRLELRGQVSHAEALALFASAEIAVVPSLWQDPCPRSAIEALASGCALIATREGGLAEIAEGAGEIVDPRDSHAFAAALRKLALDEGLRRAWQDKGRARAAETFEIARATATLDAARARLLALGPR